MREYNYLEYEKLGDKVFEEIYGVGDNAIENISIEKKNIVIKNGKFKTG